MFYAKILLCCALIVINYRKDTTAKYRQDTWNTLEPDAAWESGHMWCDDVSSGSSVQKTNCKHNRVHSLASFTDHSPQTR